MSPLTDIKRVALGSTSRTGVLLAKMLLADRYGVRPEFFRCPPELGTMLLEADAAVVIGDVALRALYEAPTSGLTVTDLGAEWRDWSGLPMVFAVWAVRKEFASAHPGLVKDVHEAFLRSRDLCLDELDEVAEAAARWLLVEWRKDGTIKYALSNLPPDTPLEQAVGLWKERWQVERG